MALWRDIYTRRGNLARSLIGELKEGLLPHVTLYSTLGVLSWWVPSQGIEDGFMDFT